MTDSTRNSQGRKVQSVWRCRWCGVEYQHPITGAVAFGHWCGDVRRELRNLTRVSRSIYDELAADQRNAYRRTSVSIVTQQGPEMLDRASQGRNISERGSDTRHGDSGALRGSCGGWWIVNDFAVFDSAARRAEIAARLHTVADLIGANDYEDIRSVVEPVISSAVDAFDDLAHTVLDIVLDADMHTCIGGDYCYICAQQEAVQAAVVRIGEELRWEAGE